MWNMRAYATGAQDARELYEKEGLDAVVREYFNLPEPLSVNEYEVGFRMFLQDKQVSLPHDPAMA